MHHPVFHTPYKLGKIILLSLLLLQAGYCGEVTAQDKPKIGLVLSGGGAKGLAHIGILKSLEEAGITPDIITGTSMGSIMGGLYAIGYTADEIKEIALSAQWDILLSNKTFMNEVVFEEKDYYNRYLYELNMTGLHLDLPKGLIEGQELSNMLSFVTRPVHDINNFKNLPIPYACIAADIETGLKVVLNEGSLARSMRASMAIPSVFTPVEIDGKLLVDGGLVHNFPVEESIEMGADVVIGVFVGNQLLRKDELDSPLSVLTQSAFIHSSFDTEVQKRLVDIYIEPDMEAFGPGSFEDAFSIIEIGEKYGQQFLDDFRNLKDSMENLGWRNRPVTKPATIDSIFVTEIGVRNNRYVPDKFILSRLGIENNSWITFKQLEEGIDHLYGTLYFTKILYEIHDNEDGMELIIDVAEAPEGKIKGALQYDLETEITLLLNLTYRNLVVNNSRFLVEGEISQNPMLDLNYLQYFGERQHRSLITGYHFRNIGIPLVENGMTSALYEMSLNRYYGGFQSSSRTNRILQLLYAHERASLRPDVVSNAYFSFDKLNYKAHQILLNFEYNDLDALYFPTRGSRHRISFKYMSTIQLEIKDDLADSLDIPTRDIRAPASISPSSLHHWVIPLNNRLSMGIKTEFDFNIHVKESIDSLELSSGILDMNYIGGYRKLMPNFHPFWGSELQEYHSEHLFSTELTLQYRIGRQIYLQGLCQFYHAYYPFGWIIPAMKNSIYGMGGRNYLLGIGARIGYLSPIGPVSFSIGKDIHSNRMHHFLNLGFYFDTD